VTGRPPALSRSTVDRAAHRRTDDEWLAAAWVDPGSRLLVVEDGRAMVDGDRLVLVATSSAPAGERYFLGTENGTSYWAVAGSLSEGADARPANLREVGAGLDDRDAGLLTHAVGLANWHATHRCCSRCGRPTEPVLGGHVRRCPADGSQHFPRTDPAVIMLVHDGGDRCVLGRGPSWPDRRYSVLAGFVEPGESAEQAVAREVAEEVGLALTDLRYAASQPWPFPSSLMLAFTARATSETLTVDATELADAGWYSRDEIRRGEAIGRLILPSPVSIARRLIDGWLADDDEGNRE
jgi:NAD+ diphosphatase